MKNSSIKKTLPRLARLMILILIILILPANILLQLYILHQSQKESSEEVFGQLEQVIRHNEEDLEREKQDFSEKCIRAADLAAYFVQYYPSVTTNLAQTRELAAKLNVDEIHYFTTEGEIYAGTHPEYYGYTFHSGEQMMFFLPMLDDPSLKLCQEITPNTTKGKEMQYAAVWMEDGSGIVQIGMEPRRILQEINDKSLENVISELPMDLRGHVYIVDADQGRIIASTAENLAGRTISGEIKEDIEDIKGNTEDIEKNIEKNIEENPGETIQSKQTNAAVKAFHYVFNGQRYCVYLKPYGSYLLIRTYLSDDSLRSSIQSTIIVLLYMALVAIAVISIIVWYADKKLSNNLTFIVNDLKKIEEGNLDNITINTGIQEFDELILYINQLLKSIRLSWHRLSNVIIRGRIPIGIFEYDLFYKKEFINERMLEILGIQEQEAASQMELSQLVRHRLEQAAAYCMNPEEQVYQYNWNGENKYLRIETFTDEQSITYYVTDVSLWWNEISALREQSSQDSLTKLYNRRGFTSKLDALFLHPERVGCGAMVMLDADGLKKINDIHGHHIGDEYLKRIGSMMAETAAGHSVCARLGGDEFVMFLYGYDSKAKLEETIAALESRRGETFISDNPDLAVSVEFSVGYACYPMDEQDYHVLMHLADENMYREKRMRKGVLRDNVQKTEQTAE
ncbi:MAG: GGDEF domain-containing protein [Lachnospiraceae bacterium]|nr:GGDEF domain-containing protein [Lachnospiraceae bacterium]